MWGFLPNEESWERELSNEVLFDLKLEWWKANYANICSLGRRESKHRGPEVEVDVVIFSNKQTKEVGKLWAKGGRYRRREEKEARVLEAKIRLFNFKYDREILESLAEERRGQIHILKLFWHQETNIKLLITTLFILAEELEAIQMPSKSRMDK